MKILQQLRALDKRLRVLFVASALLIIPIIGEFLAYADKHHGGHVGDLSLFFKFVAIFFVPTSLILSGAILATNRPEVVLRRLEVNLGVINILMSLSIAWFFFTV